MRASHAVVAFSALLALTGCGATLHDRPIQIVPSVETDPVPSTDDAADDPAIWVHPERPEDSLVLGTDKGSGLLVYGLDGQQRQYLPVGYVNNVDLRQRPWGRPGVTLIAGTQRNPSRIVLFELDHATGQVALKASHDTELSAPYGVCMGLRAGSEPFIVANSKDAAFVVYRVDDGYGIEPQRRWAAASQPEGCVVDDATQTLYFGEEARGVWRLALNDPELGAPELFAEVGDVLVADVEGMTLYHGRTEQLLVVSSQGDNSFAVFDTKSGEHRFSFNVIDGDTIDGASETDGIDITATALPGYPGGLLVVQDGHNRQPRAAQNFKLVDWRRVLKAAGRD